MKKREPANLCRAIILIIAGKANSHQMNVNSLDFANADIMKNHDSFGHTYELFCRWENSIRRMEWKINLNGISFQLPTWTIKRLILSIIPSSYSRLHIYYKWFLKVDHDC